MNQIGKEEGELQSENPSRIKKHKQDSRFPLIISSLPDGIRLTQVKDLLMQYGEVTNISFLVPNNYGVFEGYHFLFLLIVGDILVELNDKEAGRKAMRDLHKKYTFHSTSPQHSTPINVRFYDEEYYNPTKLYVTNFPLTASEEELRSIFEPFGAIQEFTMPANFEGLPKGFAFVKFPSNEEAIKAILSLHHKHRISGFDLALSVKFASRNDVDPTHGRKQISASKRKRESFTKPVYHEEMPSIANCYSDYLQYYSLNYQPFSALGVTNNMQISTFNHSVNQIASSATISGSNSLQKQISKVPIQSKASFQESAVPECNLYISNIPIEYTEMDLVSIFSPFGKVKDTFIIRDRQTNQSRGCGFASFEEKTCASAAMQQLCGIVVGGKKISVSVKRHK